MKKTLKFGEKEITFSSNANLSYIFKNQFGYDLVQKAIPLISETIRGISPYAKFEKKEMTFDNLDLENLADIVEQLNSLEITEIMNIIWAMAKANDGEIKEPELFFADIEDFDIIDCIKELAPIFINSFVSKKKLMRMFPKLEQITA